MSVESGVLEVREATKVVWKAVGALLCWLLCLNLLLSSRRLQHQFLRLVRILRHCWEHLLQVVERLMPFHPQGNTPGSEVGSLRRRVNSLDRLLRSNRVQRGAEPAVGIPVLNTNRWELLGSFLAGLWCGCIVSLLALCIGVYIGHSL